MKRVIRLTESDLHRIIKESVKSILSEGQKWIGDYDRETFDRLRQMANQQGGNCSFSLNGVDFTLQQTQRGFTLTSGMNNVCDSLNIESALKSAWQFSNSNRM
jgi:hypothetical protein